MIPRNSPRKQSEASRKFSRRSRQLRFNSTPSVSQNSNRNTLSRFRTIPLTQAGNVSFNGSMNSLGASRQGSFVETRLNSDWNFGFRTPEAAYFALSDKLKNKVQEKKAPWETYRPRNVDLNKVSDLEDIYHLQSLKKLLVKDLFFIYRLKLFRRDKEGERALFSEFGFLASSNHENLLHFKSIYTSGEFIFVIFENMANTRLLSELSVTFSYRNEAFLAQLLSQLISVINYCHTRNRVVRNLSLANIRLTKGGKIKIMDLSASIEITEFNRFSDLEKYFTSFTLNPYSIKYNKSRFLRKFKDLKSPTSVLQKLKDIKVCEDIFAVGYIAWRLSAVREEFKLHTSLEDCRFIEEIPSDMTSSEMSKTFMNFLTYCLTGASESKSCTALFESEFLSDTSVPTQEQVSEFYLGEFLQI